MRYEFSEDAQQDLHNIENYLLRFWSVKVLDDFVNKLEYAIEILLQKNVYFQKYEHAPHFKYLLTKHNSIIYSYSDEDILLIHRILQNFQDPEENLKYFDEED